MELTKLIKKMTEVRTEKEEFKKELMNSKGTDYINLLTELVHEKLMTKDILLNLIKFIDNEEDQKRIINLINSLGDDMQKLNRMIKSYKENNKKEKINL